MNHEHHHVEELERSGVDRRSFLKLAGFSFAGALLAGCQPGKVNKAIPFLIQPEEITPGLAYWYATTCAGCSAGCGLFAKNRDGRPIKLEGNPEHPVSKGGLCAIGQASLLGMYDSQRLKNPTMNGNETTWDALDEALMQELESIKKSGGAVRFLTGTITSPTTRTTINRFLSGFKNAKHVQYDALSFSAILDAHKLSHGKRVLPRFRFDKADVIVSFDADFLGTWISPVEFTKGYRVNRVLEEKSPKFSHHAQFESRLSLTGSNADNRICVSYEEMHNSLKKLAEVISAKADKAVNADVKLSAEQNQGIKELANRLWEARGKSLVICGINELECQLIVNVINAHLGNYGKTVDIAPPSYQYSGNDAELDLVLKEIESGKVSALFVSGVNPVYDLTNGAKIGNAVKNIPVVVSFTDRIDETASCAKFVCPQPHALEAWSDCEAVAGVVSVAQPTIQPLMNTRQMIECLSAWMGTKQFAHDLIQTEWQRSIFKRQSAEPNFTKFWNKTLESGFAIVSISESAGVFNASAISIAMEKSAAKKSGEYNLALYSTVAMFDGRHAHNPWLQELPDPVTKIVWDNYVSISRATAEKFNVREGDVVQLKSENDSLELPVHIQPGQHDSVVAVALGYGRKGTDRFTNIGPDWIQAKPTVKPGELVGKNAAIFIGFENGNLSYNSKSVSIITTNRSHTLAATQEYDSLHEPNLFGAPKKERRKIVQETTLAAYIANPTAGSFHKEKLDSLWPEDHTYPGHHWGMAIDLTACTGCTACVIGCQSENNIPVVGKDEVCRNRELTWIRIDRYYDEADGKFSVSHQPMMCQHCGNAPCETVCPVLATVHNDEGLNTQVYNRCVGTRYCSNNCPYKVRRFNWFQYRRDDELQNMVLNPDVTVRDRGVMEKCSFCVQRIQLAKLDAKKEERALKDGDVKPACAQSCPANAIAFGDMNDANSEITQRMKDPRYYRVLEEIGVRPSVGYMTLVHDRPEENAEVHHG